jgi:hypothetical protein
MKFYAFKNISLSPSHTSHSLYLFSVAPPCPLSGTFRVRFKGEIADGLIYRLKRERHVIQQ